MVEKAGSSFPLWQILVNARRHLDGVWHTPNSFRGRCWGSKKDGNPLGGSHITIGNEEAVVTIFQNPKTGELQICEYVRVAETTPLGEKVRSVLAENGLLGV